MNMNEIPSGSQRNTFSGGSGTEDLATAITVRDRERNRETAND